MIARAKIERKFLGDDKNLEIKMHLMPKTTRQTEHQVIRESRAIVQIAIAIAGELSNKLSSKLIENTEQTNEKGDIKKERSTDRQTN